MTLPRATFFTTLLTAGLIGASTVLVAALTAAPARADSLSIGFGYTTHGHRTHAYHGYGYGLRHVYARPFGHRYVGYGYGCRTRPWHRSSVFYHGSNLGLGLSYRTGYFPSYPSSTTYFIESPRVVTQRHVVREVQRDRPADDRRAEPAAQPDLEPYRQRASPFPQTRGGDRAEAGLDGLAIGEYATAQTAFAQAMANSPSVAEHKIGYGVAAALAGDLRKAGFAFERAVRQGGADAFDRFPLEGAALQDLHAWLDTPQVRDASSVVRVALKKLAAANPLPSASYEKEMNEPSAAL
jgi:hypothetical protein